MAKRRSPPLDYLTYLVVRILVCIIQAMTWSSSVNLARGLAWLGYRIDRRHRLVAMENLRCSFPNLDDASLDRLVRASYSHLACMAVEMIRLPRVLHHHNFYDYITIGGRHTYEEVCQLVDKGPILALTGHFGSWEVLSYVTGMLGFKGAAIYRRLDNPYLDRWVAQLRRKSGIELLDKSTDYPRILDAITRGYCLGIVGDQDAGSRGQFVNFFGRPASTYKSIALLSLEHNAPILVFGAAHVADPMRYYVYLEDIIWPSEHAKQSDPVRAITQRYTDALERMVRRHPEQYFWLHRRWKTQPKPRQVKTQLPLSA